MLLLVGVGCCVGRTLFSFVVAACLWLLMVVVGWRWMVSIANCCCRLLLIAVGCKLLSADGRLLSVAHVCCYLLLVVVANCWLLSVAVGVCWMLLSVDD